MTRAHYIDNQKFYAALVERAEQVKKALAEGKEKPPVSNYIGECFCKICERRSYAPNFINYSYRDEMIADGIEDCLKAVDNFDVTRVNPFAYFSQIAYYAFLDRIKIEKDQAYTKARLSKELLAEDLMDLGGIVDNNFLDEARDSCVFDIEGYEESQRKKREKANERKRKVDIGGPKGLESFME